MNILTHMLLVEWEETAQHEEWDFPEEPLTKEFVTFAIEYQAFLKYTGLRSEGYSVGHLIAHAYDYFDDVIKTTPYHWFYWLFQKFDCALYPDYEYFLPNEDNEYVVQPSDLGGFEVYDLTEDRVIWLENSYEEAQKWLQTHWEKDLSDAGNDII